MKKLSYLLCFLFAYSANSQTSTLDFETPETSTNFQIFGGNLEGAVTANIANPDASGVNTSATVVEGKKASDAPDWGGMFSNPNPTDVIDASNGGQICFDIWSANAVPVLLKLENDDLSNVWETSVNAAGGSAWETICYDLSAGAAPASGQFTRFVIFYDFGTVGTGTEQVFYIDNIVYPSITTTTIECQELYNFEPTTMDEYSTFGANADSTHVSADFIIDNPGADAVNGSGKVLRYTKLANAETWAGFFFDLAEDIDANFAFEICVDYWSADGGPLLLKLENASDSWETLQTSSTNGGWETLCYDLTADDVGGNATGPATGRSFNRMVLFPGFGNMGGAADTEYYIDNFLVKIDNEVEDYMVTFSVDMNSVTGFTQPYVSGTFNDWSGTANPLDDSDGDGVWETTISISQGQHEYKFNYDDWAGQEDFTGTAYACTVTDPSGQFVNRSLVVTGDMTDGTYCFNSCFACGDGVVVTVNVGQGNETVAMDGFFLAGGGNFGVPGDNPMTANGDGSHTIKFERGTGFSSHYTFTNGACADWSCKEDISGQACADPDNFNDRFMGPITQDTVINTCFGLCSTDLMCGDDALREVTFAVDMNDYTGSFTQVYMSGTFNGWSGDANPMDDSDGDNVWETTLMLNPGMIEYKFTLDNWAAQEEFGGVSYACTIVDPSGQFVNRSYVVSQDETVQYCFNSCYACGQAVRLTVNLGENGNAVSPDGFFIAGGGNFGNPGDNPLTDNGDGTHSIIMERGMGFESYYTFTNGNCPDYSCKEDISGQECADPDNFNDRYMGPFMADSEINTCFGSCMDLSECVSSTNDIEIAENLFEIRPNLSMDGQVALYVEPSFTEDKRLVIFNNVGQIVVNQNIDGSRNIIQLDMSNDANGLYFVQLQTQNKQLTKRLILSK